MRANNPCYYDTVKKSGQARSDPPPVPSASGGGKEYRMARPFAEAFYNSAAWRKCRTAYINRRIAIDGGLCEVCHRELGYIVHHKIWLTEENINDPEVTLNADNLRFECLQCHNLEEPDGGRKTAGRENQYTFDADGQIVPLPP